MKAAGKRRRPSASVSASELAQMGVCERLVVFEHRHGKRSTPAQRSAIERGLQAHEWFYRDGQVSSDARGRCFIATMVYGEGHETRVLRRFRDRALRPWPCGRWLIDLYYRVAPGMCEVLARWPVVQSAIRVALRPVVWCAERWLQTREGGGDD